MEEKINGFKPRLVSEVAVRGVVHAFHNVRWLYG